MDISNSLFLINIIICVLYNGQVYGSLRVIAMFLSAYFSLNLAYSFKFWLGKKINIHLCFLFDALSKTSWINNPK